MLYTNKGKRINVSELAYIKLILKGINRNVSCLLSVNTSFRKFNLDFAKDCDVIQEFGINMNMTKLGTNLYLCEDSKKKFETVT